MLDFIPHTGFQNTKYCGVMRCEVPNSTRRFSICPWTLFKCKIIIYISQLIISKNTNNVLWIIVLREVNFSCSMSQSYFLDLYIGWSSLKLCCLFLSLERLFSRVLRYYGRSSPSAMLEKPILASTENLNWKNVVQVRDEIYEAFENIYPVLTEFRKIQQW